MQPGNIGRPSACRFQRGEALISSCSDQGHGHHRQRHVRVKAKLDPKPVKLHWCRTVSRWPRASEEDAALGLRQSRSSRARFSAGRHGSARGCPGNATARSPSASPHPVPGPRPATPGDRPRWGGFRPGQIVLAGPAAWARHGAGSFWGLGRHSAASKSPGAIGGLLSSPMSLGRQSRNRGGLLPSAGSSTVNLAA
jgi:hypothetical protein